MEAYQRSAALPRSSGSEPSLTDAGEVSILPDSELIDLRAPLERGELSEAAKRRQIWTIFLIGFMASRDRDSTYVHCSSMHGHLRAHNIIDSVGRTFLSSRG